MNILIMGPAGSGKGTMSDYIVKEFNIPHISTGDMLRENVKNQTPLGIQAKVLMDQGKLVPDDVVNAMVKERLLQDDCKNGFIIDGFPRNYEQAIAYDNILEKLGYEIGIVIAIDIDKKELEKRITGRRICDSCHAVYNINEEAKKPIIESVCDKCGGEIIQRDDDKPESILHRMDVYKEQTQPLIDYYNKKGNMTNLDASIETPILMGEFKKIF